MSRKKLKAGISNDEIHKVRCFFFRCSRPADVYQSDLAGHTHRSRQFLQVSPRRVTWSHLRSPAVSPRQRFTMTAAFQRIAVEAKLGGHGSTESVKLPRNFDVAPTSNKTHIHTTCNAYRHCPLYRHDPTGLNMIERKSKTSARIRTHNVSNPRSYNR